MNDAAREAAERWLFESVGVRRSLKAYSDAECDWINGVEHEGDRFIEAFIAGSAWARSEQPAPASEAKAIIAKARAQASWARASSAKPPTREDMADCVDDLADFIERLSTAAAPKGESHA